jgi:hypothetical protein
MSARTSRQSRPAPARRPASAVRKPGRSAGSPGRSSARIRLPDGTRSVQSPWVWRAFLFMSLIAFGLCLTLALGHRTLYAVAWAFVTVGWFGIAMWLWRKHLADDLVTSAPERGGRRR